MAMAAPQTVAEIGELGLLQRLFKYCPASIVGDDAAVIDLPAGERLVVTTDVLVQGVHFSRSHHWSGGCGLAIGCRQPL
jgi:thiamine-monophosphate kinase